MAWIIAIITFIGLSIVLFNQYKYAEYLYPIFPIFFSFRLADFKRKEFLKICYGDRKFYLIRFLENLLLSIPFLICLIIYQHYEIAISLFLVVTGFVFTQWRSGFHFIIPTPFQKYPFEFVVGFRKTFLMIAIIFALTIIAIKVDNFYLGLFSIILGFLTSMSYYSFIEDPFYVWSHIEKPRGFLLKKIQHILIFNSLLYLPQTIALSFFFYENIYQILILYGIGNFFLVYIVFIKYAAFPNKIGLKESIILAVTIYFPPLIFITLPYFYFQSLRSLSKVLK
ncbi:hypothetical protein QYS49_39080 [Marivirga salinae]|uniref:Uncharacterized protein n=1 Tax=Marivirga salinarum TaxID=3059078 RepID=A0AA51NA65_9BACT|nr:hypothetical protein [Marivirga sp. BDSF4-3]WMN11632.1 hypothetical protein QYS49_39080 [Marivirga sp. BDSF4-3]